MTNRVHRFAFELFDVEPWLLLGQAPFTAPIPGPTQLDVASRGLGNVLSVKATRNALDARDTRNILDVE